MNSLLSVIVPVYNVEKYVRECIDSIVNQTYKNLEIVLVDDGSTDKSGQICDEYAEKDKRITVIHQTNQGAGAAKNTGLDIIKGDYFSIIDADDFIELNTYETMLNLMEKEKVDIVQCRIYSYYKNAKLINEYSFRGKRKISAKRYLYELLYDWKYAVFWEKIFKSSLLENTRFPVGRKIDDEFFTYKLVCNAQSILNIEDVFYYYRMRMSSVTNENSHLQLVNDDVDCHIERYHFVSQKYPMLKSRYYYMLSDELLCYKNRYGDIPCVKQALNFFNMNNIPKFKQWYYVHTGATQVPLSMNEENSFFE